MAAKRQGATLSNDDQGKLNELELGKALNAHPEVGRGNKLPRHWRSFSENKEHAGTPAQVYTRLKKKAGASSPEAKKIKAHAVDTASKIVESLKESGHLGRTTTNGVKHPATKITNVFWTSNADQTKSGGKLIEGDHQKTTGIHDPNSKADLMVTVAPRHEDGHHGEHHSHYVDGHGAGVRSLVASRRAAAENRVHTPPANPHPRGTKQHRVWAEGFAHGNMATHVNISAKLADKVNYENAGHESMEAKTGSKGLRQKLDDEMKTSDESIAKKLGYHTTKKDGTFNAAASSQKFKADRDVYDAEKAAHKEKTGSTAGFTPTSPAAKRAHTAYTMSNASLRRGIGHTARALQKMHPEKIKNFILRAVAPETKHETLLAHSNPKTGKNSVHSSKRYREHLDEYDNLEVQHGGENTEGGTNLHVYGTHKKTGERKPIFTLNYKTNSGAMGGRQFGVRLPQFK